MNTIWQILEIEKTVDTSAIRKAYAELIRTYHPEEHPQEFLKVREAYEEAMNYARSASAAGNQTSSNEMDHSQEKDGSVGSGVEKDRQEREFPSQFDEEKNIAAKTLWTFDPDEEDDKVNPFRNSEAIKEFLALYLSKNRADRNLWTKYFSSDIFLDVFQEKGFAKLLSEEVEANLEEYPPHKNFLIALSLTYALARPKYEMEDVFFHQNFASFDGLGHIHAIAAKGPQFHEVKGTDLAILNGYRDYFSLLHVTKGGQWNDEISGQFNELIWRYSSAYIKDKVPQSSGYQPSDYMHRHPSCLNLLAHFLLMATLPGQAYVLIWKKLDLKTAVMGRNKLLYGRLREIALARCPELETAKEVNYLQLRKDYAAYTKRSAQREDNEEDAEIDDVDQFFAREDVKAAFADPAFVSSDILNRWLWRTAGTYFLKKVLQRVSDDPSIPQGDLLVKKAKNMLRQREVQRKLKEDEAGQLPDNPVDISNRAYFRYLLNVSFHQAYTYRRSMSLASYLGDEFAYANAYAKSFLSFDEASGKCTQDRSVTLSFSADDQLEITFHLYHVTYMRNQQPVYAPFIHFDFIADQDSDDLFWLLLPLTFAHEKQEDDVQREVQGRLTALGFFDEDACTIIAECITMMICKSYEEEFYPAQLIIYEESPDLLYFSEIYLNEGVLLIGKKQVNGWREVLRNESYAIDDVNGAITLSHRLLAEYTQPFNLDILRIERLPNTVLHGFNHRKQQCLMNEEVTFDGTKALLSDFLDGKLERLELLWEGQEHVMKGVPSRSLVFLKLTPFMGNDPAYACFCFDHLTEHRYMLLSHPEIYRGDSEKVEYTSFNAGRTATYNIHQNTERIGKFLNKAIAQVSTLAIEVPHDFDMWSLEVYYNSKKSYALDMYLLGGFAYDCVAEKLSRNLQCYDYPEYMEAKALDGKVTAYEMKIKNSFAVKQHLQEFLEGKLAKLRLTWGWKEKVGTDNQMPTTKYTHILLLNDEGKYMLIFFDDQRRCLYHLVYDKEAYTGDKKLKDVNFFGIKHRPYLLHHDLNKIKESLSLLLPSISRPEGLLHLWGEYAYCSEMKVGKTSRNYEELKSLYIEG